MIQRQEYREFQIDTDGETVWVNGSDGGLIGRFGRLGIDIHYPTNSQCGEGECLYCTHKPTRPEDWQIFKDKMLVYYGIKITDAFVPKRFKFLILTDGVNNMMKMHYDRAKNMWVIVAIASLCLFMFAADCHFEGLAELSGLMTFGSTGFSLWYGYLSRDRYVS